MFFKKLLAIIFNSPQVYQLNQWLWAGDFYPQIKELKEISPDEKVLDIACGTANIAKHIRANYTGIDINKNYLDYARRKYPAHTFINSDFTEIKFAPQSFDRVIITDFIHHLSAEELNRLLPKIRSLIKKSLILADLLPNDSNPLARILYRLDQGAYIRSQARQTEIIQQFFQIDKTYTFFSPRRIYKHIVFICSPR